MSDYWYVNYFSFPLQKAEIRKRHIRHPTPEFVIPSSPVFPVSFHSPVLQIAFPSCYFQELRPKGSDVRQEELGDLVDKEMAATSAAIEEAVRRIDVSGLNVTLEMYSCCYLNWFLPVIIVSVVTDKCHVLFCH